MIIRELEPAEFERLKGHPMLEGMLTPEYTKIVVAESDGDIIGYWTMVQVVHIEPVWVDERYRGGMVVGGMWTKIREILDRLHIKAAYSFSSSTDIDGYLKRLGHEELPYKPFIFKVKK